MSEATLRDDAVPWRPAEAAGSLLRACRPATAGLNVWASTGSPVTGSRDSHQVEGVRTGAAGDAEPHAASSSSPRCIGWSAERARARRTGRSSSRTRGAPASEPSSRSTFARHGRRSRDNAGSSLPRRLLSSPDPATRPSTGPRSPGPRERAASLGDRDSGACFNSCVATGPTSLVCGPRRPRIQLRSPFGLPARGAGTTRGSEAARSQDPPRPWRESDEDSMGSLTHPTGPARVPITPRSRGS